MEKVNPLSRDSYIRILTAILFPSLSQGDEEERIAEAIRLAEKIERRVSEHLWQKQVSNHVRTRR